MSIFTKKRDIPGNDNTDQGATHVDGAMESAQPWEQPGVNSMTHSAFAYLSDSDTTLPKFPHQSFDQVPDVEEAKENIFHPVQAINDILMAIRAQTAQTKMLVQQMQRERVFNDVPVYLGATVGYEVDYGDYKFIYMLCNTDINIVSTNGFSLDIDGNQWNVINFPRGTILTVSGGSDVSPQAVWIRRCDTPLPNFVNGSMSLVTSTTNGVLTSVASSITSVTLLASRDARKSASVYNESTATLYISLNPVTTLTSYTAQVPPQGLYEVPNPGLYTGAISGLWSLANGFARITEVF